MEEITIIIKTFLREKRLFCLLESIEKYYKNIKIIIVDDGIKNIESIIKEKYKLEIRYVKIGYDLGLSYGRNLALSLLETKYFLLCDDDFVFTKETNIMELKNILEENNADIVGGVIRNKLNYTEGILRKRIRNFIKSLYKKPLIHNYYGEILKIENELTIEYFNQSNFDKFIVTDICLNFFLGNTERIKKTGAWNEKLKIGEHSDFFVRMKENNLKVITTTMCICDHYPIKTDEYLKYRNRVEEMTKILFESRKIKKQISIFPEKQIKNIYYFENNKLISKVEKI